MKSRREAGAVGIALFLLLLTPMLSAASPAASSPSPIPLPYQMVLPSGYYQPLQIDAPSIPTTISVSVSSNTSLSTAIMTNSQYTSFENGVSDISASLFLQNGTAVQHSLKVSEGLYYLVFFAYGRTANVSYGVQTFPISPYFSYPLAPPEPSGVAAYGLYNDSGKVVPYTVESSDVVGVANIASLQAFNASAPSYNDTVSGATLQLNSILVVNEKGGQQQNYWVQNTPDFVTTASEVSWADNIWNGSVSGFLSNKTVTSADGGYVYPANPGYYYSFQSSNTTYRLPLQLALVVSETAVSGVGVTVQVGAQLIHNGPAPVQAISWFDNATIHDPSVQSAYFEVSGNATVPDGLFYESELVFGGEGNGESTQFTQLSASLGLFYGNSTANAQTAYPSDYSFGGNTGEAADNLQVSYTGNGFSSVSAGTPDYVYLGRESGSYTLPLAGAQTTSTTTSSTASITTSSVTPTTTSPSTTSSATSSASSSASVVTSAGSSASSSSSGASSTSLPASYLLLVAVQIGVILLFCSVAALRRIGKQT